MSARNAKRQAVKPPEARSVEPVAPPSAGGRLPLRRYEWLVLAAILLTGVVLRASYLHELRQQPDFDMPMLDPAFHDYWARALASGDWSPPALNPDPEIRTTPFGRPPLYPYFLALIYKLTGSSYGAARIVQMGLGLLSAGLMWLLARSICGRAVGLLAAGGMALYWGFIYYEGQLEGPVLEVFCLLALMHLLRLWRNKASLPRAFAAGLLFGLFILLRPNAVLVAPVLLAWMAWMLWRRRQLRRILAVAAVTCAGMVLVVAPVTIRNYRVSGEFFLVTYTGPVNLYMGNNPNADSTTPTIPELIELTGSRMWTGFHYPQIVRGIARKLGKDSITYAEAGRYFNERGREYIKAHPGKTFERIVKRAFLFWGPMEVTSNDVTYYTKLDSPTLHYMPGFRFVLALALLGLAMFVADWHSRREGRDDHGAVELAVFMGAFVAAYFATFLPFIVSCRFRVPLIPFLLLPGAYAVHRLAVLASARSKAAGLWGGLGVGLLLLSSVEVAPYKPELGYWHLMRGVSYRLKHDYDHAADDFQAAIETSAETKDIMPYVFLAEMRTKQRRFDEAVTLYRQALRIDPKFTVNCLDRLMDEYLKMDPNDAAFPTWSLDLGEDIEKLGGKDTAVKFYNVMLLKIPGDAKVLGRLAPLLAEKGRPDDAVAQYLQAGSLMLKEKRIDEAVEQYKRALSLDAKNKQANASLGTIRTYQGAFEDALGYYEQALDADPKDASVLGLKGMVLERLGRTGEAVACYEKALELAPTNAAARDALERLRAKPPTP